MIKLAIMWMEVSQVGTQATSSESSTLKELKTPVIIPSRNNEAAIKERSSSQIPRSPEAEKLTLFQHILIQ